MRLIRMSSEVFGFDKIEACIAFFEHVLQWNKYRFNIIGEGHHLSVNSFNKDEIFLFTFDGIIVSVARVGEYIFSYDEKKVVAVILNQDTLKVLKNEYTLNDLSNTLIKLGYKKEIIKSQGWNIIDKIYEEKVMESIIKNEWKELL